MYRLVVAALLATLATGSELAIPPGGAAMDHAVLGRSCATDYRGHQYLFFALAPSVHHPASIAMLRDGGVVHAPLHRLYGRLLDAERPKRSFATVHVGASLGGFSLYASSRGRRVIAFEAQSALCHLMELSRRVNGYAHMEVIHASLWNESGVPVNFNTIYGTSGEVAMRTSCIDDYIGHAGRVFFLRMDASIAAHRILEGFASALITGRVKHLSLNLRRDQEGLIVWLYEIRFKCGLEDGILLPHNRLLLYYFDMLSHGKPVVGIYCRWMGQASGEYRAALYEASRTKLDEDHRPAVYSSA